MKNHRGSSVTMLLVTERAVGTIRERKGDPTMGLFGKALSLLVVISLAGAFLACSVEDDIPGLDAPDDRTDARETDATPETDVPPPVLGEPEWRTEPLDPEKTTDLEWRGISGAILDDGYLVGAVGRSGRAIIYSSLTGDWRWRAAPVEETLHGIWLESLDNVVVVGEEATILRWDPSLDERGGWLNEHLSMVRPVTLTDIWGTRESGQFVCGHDSVLARYDTQTKRWDVHFHPGAELLPDLSPPTRIFRALHGSGPNDVFAVGNRIIGHYDGREWRFSEVDTVLHGVWVAGPNKNVYAVGDEGYIFVLERSSGASEWVQEQPFRIALYDVWGLDPDRVYAVGVQSNVLNNMSGDWDWTQPQAKPGLPPEMMVPQNLTLRGVWGTSPTDLFLISSRHHLIRYTRFPR